jgi:hypothetical protein
VTHILAESEFLEKQDSTHRMHRKYDYLDGAKVEDFEISNILHSRLQNDFETNFATAAHVIDQFGKENTKSIPVMKFVKKIYTNPKNALNKRAKTANQSLTASKMFSSFDNTHKMSYGKKFEDGKPKELKCVRKF